MCKFQAKKKANQFPVNNAGHIRTIFKNIWNRFEILVMEREPEELLNEFKVVKHELWNDCQNEKCESTKLDGTSFVI